MKKYILLLLMIWLSSPIFSMEEGVVEAPGSESETEKSGNGEALGSEGEELEIKETELKSLTDLALEAIAKEAIKQYDTGGYNNLELYISRLPKDLVEDDDMLFCQIIHNFQRIDIFVKRFLELGQESPQNALSYLKTLCLSGQVDTFLKLIQNPELFEKNKDLINYIIENIDDRDFLNELSYNLEKIWMGNDIEHSPEKIQALELWQKAGRILKEEMSSIEKLEPKFKSDEEIREKGIKLLEDIIRPMVLIDEGAIIGESEVLNEIISNLTRLFIQEIDKLSFEELVDILKFYLFDYGLEDEQSQLYTLKIINTLFNLTKLSTLTDSELKKYINVFLILLQEYINNYKLTYYAYKKDPSIAYYNNRASVAKSIENRLMVYLAELAQRLIKDSMLATKPSIKVSKINQIYNYLPVMLSRLYRDLFIPELLEKGLTFETEEKKLNYLSKAIDVIFNIILKIEGKAWLIIGELDEYIDDIEDFLNDKYKDIDKDKLAEIIRSSARKTVLESEPTEKKLKYETDEAEEPED